MKRNILTAILFAGIALTACNDDLFLTEKPKTIYTTATAFEKSTQVEAQLIACYRAIYPMHGYAMLNDGLPHLLGGVGADYFDVTNALVGYGAAGYSNYATWNSTTDKFTEIWDGFYKLASYANLVFLGSENVTWDSPADRVKAEAQAHFFRGYAYLRLGECFGGVPIVKEYTESLKDDYTRATRAEVFQFAIDEFTAAAAGLPDYPEHKGSVAKGIANHFLAEACLALGVENGDASCYDKAISAAQATIALHPLMTSRFGVRANPNDTGTDLNGISNYKKDGNVFYDLFQIGNYAYSDGNTESLWIVNVPDYDTEKAFGANPDAWGYGMYMFTTNHYSLSFAIGPIFRDMKWAAGLDEGVGGPFENADQRLYPGGSNCAYLGGWSIGRVAETKYVSEKVWAGDYADDMRNDPINICRDFVCINKDHSRYGQVVKAEDINEPTRMYPIRAKNIMQDGWGWHPSEVALHTQQYGRDLYIARSAETYLLLAEAYLRKGDKSNAAATINVLRSRAQASKMISASEIDIYTVLDERAREVSYEERRFCTLLRMGSSQNGGSNEVMRNQLMNNAMYIADQPYYTGDIKWTLFPIPENVIKMNTGAVIEQNPGW